MSVAKKLIHGAFWNAVGQFGSQAANFIIILILARLLDPSDFGLLGMITVFTTFLGYFSECGLTPSLIQKKDVDNDDYDTVFWSTLCFAFAAYGLVYLGAPLIAHFYQNNALTPIVRVLFISFIFSPFGFVPETIEKKSLSYGKIVRADLVSLFVSGGVGIVLACMKFGVWSLVWLEVTRVFLRSLSLMILVRWSPRFSFSMIRLKLLMRSGIHFTFSNLLSYLQGNLDFIIVGKLLGANALGIYSFAFRISRYPFMKLWGIFGQMLFPVFASFQHEQRKMDKNFSKVSMIGGLVLIPLALFLFFGMESLTRVLFGEKWFEIVPVVRILLVYLLIDSISMADHALMVVYGRIKDLNFIRAAGALCLLVLGYEAARRFGILGMALIFTTISLVDSLIIRIMVLRQLKLTWLRSLTVLAPIGGMALVLSGIGLAALCYLRPLMSDVSFLAILAVIYAVTITVFLFKWNMIDLKNMRLTMDVLLESK